MEAITIGTIGFAIGALIIIVIAQYNATHKPCPRCHGAGWVKKEEEM